MKLVAGERLFGSHGGDHRTGEDGGTPVQVGQGRHGGRIGPVEVIEEQDEGGMGPPQPDERLERRRLRRRGAGRAGAKLGEHRCQGGQAGVGDGRGAERLAQSRGQGDVGQVALELRAVATAQAHPRQAGRQLVQQPGLAHPVLSFDHGDGQSRIAGLPDQGLQAAQLGPAPDEGSIVWPRGRPLAFQGAGQQRGGGLLSQDGRLDLPGLGRRLQPQVLRQQGPQALVPGQAFSLVSLGVVGQHGQPVGPLGVGIDGHGGLCMVDGGPGVAFGQGGLGRV